MPARVCAATGRAAITILLALIPRPHGRALLACRGLEISTAAVPGPAANVTNKFIGPLIKAGITWGLAKVVNVSRSPVSLLALLCGHVLDLALQRQGAPACLLMQDAAVLLQWAR